MSEAHRFQTEEHRDEQDDEGDGLLDDFQAQDQVGPPLHVEQVEVDGRDAVGNQAEAENLHQRDASQPFVRQEERHQRAGAAAEPQQHREDHEAGELDVFLIDAEQALVVVLDLAEDGEGDAVEPNSALNYSFFRLLFLSLPLKKKLLNGK